MRLSPYCRYLKSCRASQLQWKTEVRDCGVLLSLQCNYCQVAALRHNTVQAGGLLRHVAHAAVPNSTIITSLLVDAVSNVTRPLKVSHHGASRTRARSVVLMTVLHTQEMCSNAYTLSCVMWLDTSSEYMHCTVITLLYFK